MGHPVVGKNGYFQFSYEAKNNETKTDTYEVALDLDLFVFEFKAISGAKEREVMGKKVM